MAQDKRPLTGKASGHRLSSSTSIVYHLHLHTAFPHIRTTLTQRVLSLFLELVCLSMSRGLLPPECWSIQASSDEHYLFADWVIVIEFLRVLQTEYDDCSLTFFFFSTVPNIDTTKYFSSSPMTSPRVACWKQTRCVPWIGCSRTGMALKWYAPRFTHIR